MILPSLLVLSQKMAQERAPGRHDRPSFKV